MQLDVLNAIEGEYYPFEFEEAIPEDVFSPREIRAAGKMKIDGEYSVADGFVTVEYHIELPLAANCDRCLDAVELMISSDAQAVYHKNPEEDDGTYCYKGCVVDLTDAVRDEVLMRLPASVLCKPDCKGLCPVCGANRNRETCGCVSPPENSPFQILKNATLGGANDGSTEK